jgi:phosphate transport system permease protein
MREAAMVAGYNSRKRKNAIVMALCIAATAVGLAWLLIILATLLWNGVGGLSLSIFTQMTPPPNAQGGGLLNAIVGSLVMTFIGVAIGTPIGLFAGTYMAEYGRYERLTTVTRFINDILLSAPSIIIGLFIYGAVVVPMRGFSGIAGALALAVIVIPVVVRTTENMLLLVPQQLREAASALGMPRANVIVTVAYRAARVGLTTGVLLAVARVSGETAPLLFTALSNQFWSLDLMHEVANLPVTINNFINNPDPNWKRLAWAGALLITFAVLTLNVVARTIGSRSVSK